MKFARNGYIITKVRLKRTANAGIAQSVEHFTRNEGVVSSSLISGFLYSSCTYEVELWRVSESRSAEGVRTLYVRSLRQKDRAYQLHDKDVLSGTNTDIMQYVHFGRLSQAAQSFFAVVSGIFPFSLYICVKLHSTIQDSLASLGAGFGSALADIIHLRIPAQPRGAYIDTRH